MARVVILGGGFAGAWCARELERIARGRDLDVLLIDRHNYFVFYPLLVEAGVGSLEPRHAIVPTREMLTRATRFRMAEVLGVDTGRREVTYRMMGDDEATRVAPYDHLVVALGSVSLMPPIPGLREFAFEVKTLGHAVALRDRAIWLLEVANTVEDRARRRALLHFVVVGASHTGVRVAGDLHQFLDEASRSYRHITRADWRVTLVEGRDRILPTETEDLARYSAGHLRRIGVRLKLNACIREITREGAIVGEGERLAAATVIWCAGIAPNPLLARLPLERDERGWLRARSDLRAEGHDNVWLIGDCANVPADKPGERFPATAQHGLAMGIHAARNIVASLDGRAPLALRLKKMSSLSALGHRRGIAEIAGWRFTGFFAWWLWRTYYLLLMPTWKRRIRVAADWTLDLFFGRDIVQLGLGEKKGMRDEG